MFRYLEKMVEDAVSLGAHLTVSEHGWDFGEYLVSASIENDGHGKITMEIIPTYRRATRVVHVIQRAWRRRQLKKKTVSALKIQRAWRKCTSDPSHAVCKRRLLREFKEL